MNALMIYLAESTLCFALLSLVYWIFLKRETFFRANRFYLLAMVLFSVTFPLLPLQWSPSPSTAPYAAVLETVVITSGKVKQTLSDHLRWIEVAGVVYLTGVAIFLIRFVFQLFRLFLIARRSGSGERNGRKVVFVDRGYSPFSFFGLVFINESMVPEESLPVILEHEKAHARQFHSVDSVLLELASILHWYNPVVWMIGHEIKSIHEYLADEAVLQNGISRPRYQQMILDETMGVRVNDLTNSFNVSLLKKRIIMMTKKKSRAWAKSKLLIALPALLALFFTLNTRSFSNAMVLTGTDSPISVTKATAPVPASAPAPLVQDKKEKPKTSSQNKKDKDGHYTVVDKMPAFPGGEEARIRFLVDNIRYPEAAIKSGVQGKVFVTFLVKADGSVTDVRVMRGIGSGCDEEALRVVKMMPKWEPGEVKGKPVDVIFNLPIKFALESGKKDKSTK